MSTERRAREMREKKEMSECGSPISTYQHLYLSRFINLQYSMLNFINLINFSPDCLSYLNQTRLLGPNLDYNINLAKLIFAKRPLGGIIEGDEYELTFYPFWFNLRPNLSISQNINQLVHQFIKMIIVIKHLGNYKKKNRFSFKTIRSYFPLPPHTQLKLFFPTLNVLISFSITHTDTHRTQTKIFRERHIRD